MILVRCSSCDAPFEADPTDEWGRSCVGNRPLYQHRRTLGGCGGLGLEISTPVNKRAAARWFDRINQLTLEV